MFIDTKNPVNLLYTLILDKTGKIEGMSFPEDLTRNYKITAVHGDYHYTISATITNNNIQIGLVILNEET
jgi:hypothetical protein